MRGAEGDKADAQQRPLAQRLDATLRRGQEALSPRELRKLLQEMQQVAEIDSFSGDIEVVATQGLMEWYAKAEPVAHKDFWLLAIEQFGPDAKALQAARERYDKAGSDVERSEARNGAAPRANLIAHTLAAALCPATGRHDFSRQYAGRIAGAAQGEQALCGA